MAELSKTELSKVQKAAVESIQEPVLILAGPGTGKTRVMIAKIIHLVRSGISPQRVLAMTFSRRAVGEIEERLMREAPELYGRTQVTTIHALCVDLVQRHAFRLGFGRRTQLISESQAALMLRSILPRTPMQDFFKRIASDELIQSLLALFQECKDNGIWPEQLVSYAYALPENSHDEMETKKEWVALAETYQAFQSHCFDRGYLDFGDALMAALRLLEEHPSVKAEVQKEFEAILVDEFQDTSWIQIQLLRHLAAPTTHVSVVGDDDQAIYRFRGASYSAFSFFEKEFPTLKVVDLNETYRLPDAVAQVATTLIQKNGKNRYRPDKIIRSKNSHRSPVQAWQFPDFEEEASQILSQIETLIASGVAAEEIAVLARSHNHLDSIVNLAHQKNIAMQVSSTRNLYESEIVRDLMAFLSLVYNPRDPVSLYRLFDSVFLGLSADEILDFSEKAQFKTSVFTKIMSEADSLDLQPSLKEKLTTFSKLLGTISAESFSLKLSEVLFSIYNATNLIAKLQSSKQSWATDLASFHEQVQAWEALQERQDFRNLFPLLENLVDRKLKLSDEEIETSTGRVHALTVHASKGLEFEYVFVVSLVGRRFPSNFSVNSFQIPQAFRHEAAPNKESHEEEERRLLYVAMTRAKKELVLSTISKKGTKPSLFLIEDLKGLPANLLQWKEFGLELSPVERLAQRSQVFSRVAPPKEKPSRSKKKLSLSFTQINDYEDCPQKYWFRYELRIPVAPKVQMSFGSAMHEALEQFYKSIDGNQIPEKEILIQKFEQSFKHYQRSDLSLDEEHLELGRKALSSYYDAQENHFQKPIGIEASFKLELGEHTLAGKIDRADPSPDGVSIIDYKTGKTYSGNDEANEKKAKESLQFSIYALAARDFFGWKLKEMLFYNLMDQTVLRTTRNDEEITKTREHVQQLADRIQTGQFEATPGFHCQWCDFRKLCPQAS